MTDEGGFNDDEGAVKPSRAIGHEGEVILRRTFGGGTVILDFTPEDALRYGRALIDVALDLGATP